MENKSLYELGKLAQAGDDMAMLEIIERKKDDDKSRNHGLFSYFKRYSKKRYCTSCK